MDMQNLERKIRLRNTIHFFAQCNGIVNRELLGKGYGEPIEKD
jgi:hypothetical protein